MGDPNTRPIIPGLPINNDITIAEPLNAVVRVDLAHGFVENGTSSIPTAKKHKLPDTGPFEVSPSKLIKHGLGLNLPESLPRSSTLRSPPLVVENKTSTTLRTREEWSFTANLDLGQDLLLDREPGCYPFSPTSPKSFENLIDFSSANLNNTTKDLKSNHEPAADGVNQGLERPLENIVHCFPESIIDIDKYYGCNKTETLGRDKLPSERYSSHFRNCNSQPRSQTVTSNAFNLPDVSLPYQPSENDNFFISNIHNNPKLPELKNHTITSSDSDFQDLAKTITLEQPMKDQGLKFDPPMIDFCHLTPLASQSGLIDVHSCTSNYKMTSGTNLPHQDAANLTKMASHTGLIGLNVPSSTSNSNITSGIKLSHQAQGNMIKIDTIGIKTITKIDCSNISLNPNQQRHANEPINNEKHLFNELLTVFPDIDKEFLITRCREIGDSETIANSILEMGNNYPKDKTLLHKESNVLPNIPMIETPNATSYELENIDTGTNGKLEFLKGVFPDADSSYLELKSKLNQNEITALIVKAYDEKKDYPKIQLQTTQIKDENKDDECNLGLYTTSFDVEKFIKIFPDPCSYFLDDKRVCQSSSHGKEFLKRRYRQQSVTIIDQTYKLFKYHLTKTCEMLDTLQPSIKNKRAIAECKISTQQNLLFIQEVCFIEHKAEIQEFFHNKAETKRIAYEEAKERNELIECSCCCYQVMFEDCATCDDGDLFCKECIKRHVEFRIGDAHVSFPCLSDCGSNFSLTLLQDLIDARAFSRLLQRIQLDEVKSANIEGLEICPFCEFATIPPPDTNIFTCLNTECLKESCRKCHKVSHIPMRCEEVENDDQARARKYIEDEMTKALVRECYKCKKSFIKVDGCNKMTCTCGAKMCYICREPIADYKHFNGPGGSEKKKCPLYSTEKVLHVDAVQAVGEQAKQIALQQNPELKLKHDPTTVLPSPTKVKTSLPPGVEEDANMLVAHMQRHYNHAYVAAFNDFHDRLPVQPVIPAVQPLQLVVQPHQPVVQPHQPAVQPHQLVQPPQQVVHPVQQARQVVQIANKARQPANQRGVGRIPSNSLRPVGPARPNVTRQVVRPRHGGPNQAPRQPSRLRPPNPPLRQPRQPDTEVQQHNRNP